MNEPDTCRCIIRLAVMVREDMKRDYGSTLPLELAVQEARELLNTDPSLHECNSTNPTTRRTR